MIHTVKAGETLAQISQDYRTPLASIIAANPGIQPDHLVIGQQIVIPACPTPRQFLTVSRSLPIIAGYVYIETISFKTIPYCSWTHASRNTSR